MCHDGFENLMRYNLNSNMLEDVLTESNSHQGDICLMKSAKKIQIQQIQNQICPKNEKKGRSRQETLKVSNERNLLE